jgi:Spy/CpxP family protein refolding chaperone
MRFRLLIVSAVLLGIAVPASAQKRPVQKRPGVGVGIRGGRMTPMNPNRRLAPQKAAQQRRDQTARKNDATIEEALGLDESQREKFAAIMRAMDEASAPVLDDLQRSRDDLRHAAFADDRNEKNTKTLADKVTSLEKQLLDIELKADDQLAAILTPEQRDKMRAQGDTLLLRAGR